MIRNNLFPAILLAGPPHSGKSVLAFLLTQRLRELRIEHYLLRAVPDGEGDWFLNANPALAQTLRTIHKTKFSAQFIEHMRTAIDHRLLPLLVDAGGRPQGEQLGIIKACTHAILLYRTEEDRLAWKKLIEEANLIPIAELHSALNEHESITERQPYLRGTIGGLDREAEKRKPGMVFGALLERVSGICSYDTRLLEQEHLRNAQFRVADERELAQRLSVPVDGKNPVWSPGHIAHLPDFVPQGVPLSIYGRGPVWLAAALAVHALPAPCSIFDARFGWMILPDVSFSQQGVNLESKVSSMKEGDAWLEIELPDGTLEPGEIIMRPALGRKGIVISGKLPRWLFAALARKLAPEHEWIGVDVPNANQVVVIYSNDQDVRRGDVLPRPV